MPDATTSDWAPPPDTAPLIIDTDIGDDPDDTIALIVAAALEPQLALVVTCDERDGARARFARQVLAQCRRHDVEVVEGSELRAGPPLCVQELINPAVGRQDRDVETAVSRVVDRTEGPVRWAGLGYLSNLAALCARRPDLVSRLDVTQMGGALDVPTGRPEYNFRGDPAAVRTVLDVIRYPNLVVADLTYQEPMRVTPDSAICAGLTGAADGTWQHTLGSQFRAWFDIPKDSYQHDPLALSVALDRGFVDFEQARLAVDDAGRTTIDPAGAEVWLSRSVAYAPFMAWLHRALGAPTQVGSAVDGGR